MIKALEFPKIEFESRTQMFLHLKTNAKSIIEQKKIHKRFSDNLTQKVVKLGVYEVKGLDNLEDGYIYPIVNTTNIMDSHKDVHLNGIWTKNLKESKGNRRYLANHKDEIGNIIAFPKDVESFTAILKWRELGYDSDGETQALVYKVKPHSSAPPQALAIIEEKIPIQNSVKMHYVKISLAVNSTDEDFKEEYKTFNKYIDNIINKEEVLIDGYYWAVTEAENIDESSMVTRGSNTVTPIKYPTNEPLKSKPLKDTYEDTRRKMLMQHIK